LLFSVTWQDASVGAGHAREIAHARGLLCVSANRVLLGWLQSRARPARTNKTSVGAGHARDISYACREMQG